MLKRSVMRRMRHMTERSNHVRLYVLVMCLLCFRGLIIAEDTTYSADSLMATFKKGSPISVKGTEITLTGTVAEIKKSSVLFKSSDKDKVICELTSPIDGT